MDKLLRWRPRLAPLTLALLASVFFAACCNRQFLAALYVNAGDHAAFAVWLVVASALTIAALQYVLLAPLVNRWTVKPLLGVLLLATGPVVYFMHKYHIYVDVQMLRNVQGTDVREARELFGWDALPWLGLYVAVPMVLLWRVELVRAPLRRWWWRRGVTMLAALLIASAAMVSIWRVMGPLMREQKELRYLITPANYLYALARIGIGSAAHLNQPRQVVGADARVAPGAGGKPRLLVIVVGETVRAANWGLSGYARQTTPELARLGVINFSDVSSCGTNTETSLPCMFSAQGRRHYDENLIRHSESLLNVLAHAGIPVLWRDNQTGCKHVCDGPGIKYQSFERATLPGLCDKQRCLDEILLHGLRERIAASRGDSVIVLHQLGNHGPAYYQRYPAAFRRWTPTCDSTDFSACTRQQIVNTYDNAVLYTDHVLALTIELLQSQAASHDSALVYVSDHGESLGEAGLYLHSLPRAIAPDVQTKVPMVWWLSPGFARSRGLDLACLAREARAPASHDNLFSTVLGLLDVRTQVRDPEWDLTHGCRPAMPARGD